MVSDTEVRNTGHTRYRYARRLKFAVAGGESWRRDHTSNPFEGKTREYGEKLRREPKYERKGVSMVRRLAFLLVTILLGMSWLGFAESIWQVVENRRPRKTRSSSTPRSRPRQWLGPVTLVHTVAGSTSGIADLTTRGAT